MTHEPEPTSSARTAAEIGEALEVLPCPTCNGTGQVEGRRVEWIRVGEQMRQEREARGLTLRAEADRRAMGLFVLEHMELGLVQPVPAEDLGL